VVRSAGNGDLTRMRARQRGSATSKRGKRNATGMAVAMLELMRPDLMRHGRRFRHRTKREVA
jgi:hypothetical protein